MTTTLHAFRSQVILSVKVRRTSKSTIFLVTEDPTLMDLVRELLVQMKDAAVSIVWLTSVESACRRLKWGETGTVVVDGTHANDNALEALHTAAPDTRVLVLSDEAAPRKFI